MKNLGISSISFQYLAKNADKPSDKHVTDVSIALQSGMPIPRVGEIVRHQLVDHLGGEVRDFFVLSVHHTIRRNPKNHQELLAWHVTVTLGDVPENIDHRPLHIRG